MGIAIEIINELKNKGDPEFAKGQGNFFKEKLNFYGVRVPITRKITKDIFNKYKKNLTLNEALKISEELLKDNHFESGVSAFQILYGYRKKFDRETFNVFSYWGDKYIKNWAHCDELGPRLIHYCLENDPSLFNEVVHWTKDRNLWKRRLSAVSLIFFARKRKRMDYVFRIAENLMEDDEDMVQKGVGWLLKDASLGDRARVIQFLIIWKEKTSRVTLRYACERLSKIEKERILK